MAANGTGSEERGANWEEWELLTPNEAARMLRVSIGTLAAWRYRYPPMWLPWVRVGTRVRYRKHDLQSFLRRHASDLLRDQRKTP